MTIVYQTVTAGNAYSRTLNAPNAELFLALNLPQGLSINQNSGVISGELQQAGRFAITILARGAGGTGAAVLDLTVIAPPTPFITSVGAVTHEMATAFSYQITASSPTAILSYGATNLPTGLSVNTGTGLITGTPTSASNEAVVNVTATVSATNAAGTGSQNLIFTLQQRPVITSSLTPLAFTVGSAITPYTITASKSPTLFGASPLPAGLSVNTNTGIISGTPQAGSSGSYSIIVSATNAVLTGNATLPTTVNELPVITSPSTATATYLQNFSYQITASGTPSPTSYGATSFPPPLSLNSSTGAITGQISGPPYGSVSAGVSATNAVGTGSLPVTLNIVGLAADIVTQPRGVHKIGATYFLLLLTYSGATPTAPWYVYTSTDRVTWTKSLLTSSPGFQLVNNVKTVYDGAAWVFITDDVFSNPTLVFSTSNGTSWTRSVATGNFGAVSTSSLTYFSGKYLMFGSGNSAGSTMYSTDKTTWANAGGGAGSTSDDYLVKCDTISGVALRTGRQQVVTAKSAARSTNGISWSYYNVPFISYPSYSEPYVAAGNGVFIGMPAFGVNTATYYRSTDGLNWTSYTVPTGNSSSNIRITFIAGKFWWNIYGGGFGAYSSTDGITWTSNTFLSNNPALPQYYSGSSLAEVDTSNSGEVGYIAAAGVSGGYGFPFATVISNTARNSWTSSNSITI